MSGDSSRSRNYHVLPDHPASLLNHMPASRTREKRGALAASPHAARRNETSGTIQAPLDQNKKPSGRGTGEGAGRDGPIGPEREKTKGLRLSGVTAAPTRR
mgnify:CR=1 FL=1|jgi:hypothetical protein